ncbi:hypothetical protein SNE32_15490 [Lysobacter sp. D1-1-M9]|uniref:hypothetical protein n=1 Tax=Novilysobacter longmucuonensis TaxID=3098603 RepID=UPI002FCB01D3
MVVLVVLLVGMCTYQTRDTDLSPTPAAASPAKASSSPVSAECTRLAEAAEISGIVRPVGVDASGATFLAQPAWAQLDFETQARTAQCISRYMAGGQDRHIRKIVFRNQGSGVVYGTLELDRYRVGD